MIEYLLAGNLACWRVAFLAVFLLGPIGTTSSAAEANTAEPPDLKILKARYQTDLQTAVKPVQQQYISRLEALLKSLTVRGDLAGALAVDTELKSVREQSSTGATTVAGQMEELRASLLKGSWTWEHDSSKDKLAFLPNGKVSCSFSASWEITAARTVTMARSPTERTVLMFDPAIRSYKGLDFDGTTPVEGKRSK